MTRYLVLVEIHADTPLGAEALVGQALEAEGLRDYFVHQTLVRTVAREQVSEVPLE